METFIYFWKPSENNGFLGNWYYSPFVKNEIRFIHNEQYFMWKKLQIFDPTNKSLEKTILETTNPAIIKNLGRLVKNFNLIEWDAKKYEIMKSGLIEKFSQNTELQKLLLNTNNAILAEASPYDTIWGIGISEKDVKCKKWRGENLLGKALMEVRNIIRSTQVNL